MWMRGGVGMGVGGGYEVLSIWGSFIVMVVVVVLMYVEGGMECVNEEGNYEIVCAFDENDWNE